MQTLFFGEGCLLGPHHFSLRRWLSIELVRVGFSNSYRGTTDDAAILRVTGEKGAAFFKQSFELKIKGDLIPESAAEEIIGELQALFARHNAGGALSAKAGFKPTKEFHTARHWINFKLGMLNFEFLQLSSFRFFSPWCRWRRA
ncbi:MAG: hypothetical protein NTV93_16630 [Verrucomicrobia bacterium]|nr:hypothetical protein [Verrucomicrobiota bacterium]